MASLNLSTKLLLIGIFFKAFISKLDLAICSSLLSVISTKGLKKNLLFEFQVIHTAIPYRVRTGTEQGFPLCTNSHKEKPFFITGNLIAGILYSLQEIPCEN